MPITVGTDTYVTIADADAYLALHYVSTDAQLLAWSILSDTDKEIYLRNATQAIDKMPYPGIKSVSTQALAFPREKVPSFPPRRDYPMYYSYFSDYWFVNQDVPDEVKFAQIEEALELASPGVASGIKNRTLDGIQSFREGDYQETRISGGGISGVSLVVRQSFSSIKAQQLIGNFTGGSVRTV